MESEKLDVAGIQGVDNLMADMLQANPDRDKLKLLPGYDEKLQDILHAYKTHAEPFIKGKEPIVAERNAAAERFETTLNARRDQNAADSIKLITKFRWVLEPARRPRALFLSCVRSQAHDREFSGVWLLVCASPARLQVKAGGKDRPCGAAGRRRRRRRARRSGRRWWGA